MRIGLFADPHGATLEVSCKTRRPCLSEQKLRQAMETFAECDAVICLGDLVDDCGTREANIEYLQRLAKLIGSFGIPFYCILGNHDCFNFTKSEFYSLSGFCPPPKSIELSGNTFVFLDACFSSDGRSYSPDGIDWTDSYIPDRESLAQILNGADRAYIFVHQCLDPTVERRHIIKNAEDIRRIIKDSGKVTDVYQGHYHNGKESIIDGIAYHTLPAMVEGEGNSFKIIEI